MRGKNSESSINQNQKLISMKNLKFKVESDSIGNYRGGAIWRVSHPSVDRKEIYFKRDYTRAEALQHFKDLYRVQTSLYALTYVTLGGLYTSKNTIKDLTFSELQSKMAELLTIYVQGGVQFTITENF